VQEACFEAGASSGLMAALFTGGIALPHVAASGNNDLVDRFVRPTLAGELIGSLAVTEPGGGSDVANLRTTAQLVTSDGDPYYLVNGTKTFITSGVRADFVTTAVRTGGEGHAGLSLLVVEKGTPGVTVDRALTKMGWHCSDTAELGFADAKVPAGNLVGAENTGFHQIAEQFVVERIALAVHGYGIAARSLDLTAAHCRERETFGKPLIANQVVRHALVEMRRQVEVARAYTHEVARRHVAGESVIAEFLTDVDDPLFDFSGVRNQHDQDLSRCQQHELDVPHHGTAEVRVLHHGHLVGQLRQQPHSALQDIVQVL